MAGVPPLGTGGAAVVIVVSTDGPGVVATDGPGVETTEGPGVTEG